MTLNAVSDAVVNYADPGDFITNAVASQVDGVGGSGGDYQMQTAFEYPLSLETGYFISRFISNYASGTDTKTGIETEFGLGGWPIQDSVLDLGGTGSVGVASAANLSAGTDYVGLHFWISTAYYTRIFVDGTHTLTDAINDTVGDGGTTVYPTGDAVIATNSLTISGTVTAGNGHHRHIYGHSGGRGGNPPWDRLSGPPERHLLRRHSRPVMGGRGRQRAAHGHLWANGSGCGKLLHSAYL